MKLLKHHPILFIPLGLLLTFLILPFLGNSDDHPAKRTQSRTTVSNATGFLDYDLLPEALKQTMNHLVQRYPEKRFRFYYFFRTDDINRHFYMVDPGMKVITEMPVTDEEALNRIDEKLYEIEARKRGLFVAHDTTNYRKYRLNQEAIPIPEHKFFVFYVLPAGSVDFRQLRVAIVEDTISQYLEKYVGSRDLTVYNLEQVDIPPRPMRGIDYFQDAVAKEAKLSEVFALFDTGTVTVEFTVGARRVHSPNLVRGFSSWSDTYEAYQADGEFLKAVNNAKVWWNPGIKDGQPVRTKMRVSFEVDSMTISSIIH